jgi:hypothetical protein
MQQPFVPYRMPLRGLPRPFRRGLGAVSCNIALAAKGGTLATAGVAAGSAIAAGATIGSVAGPIGAAVGALAGIAVQILTPSPNTAAHIGSWDSQLVGALAALPSTVAGVGRQIPWNENSHGLVQYLEALLACGQYMSWDNQLILNYDVCAHWAMTLSAAAQTVATAVCQNKPGASVTVQITSEPGGPVGPAPFTFKNPAINSGPEAVTDAVIMGSSGVMQWLFSRWQIAGTAALSKQYAAEMGSNVAATKVYALMVDYVAGNLNVPDTIPATPVPDVSTIPAKVSTTVTPIVVAAPVSPTPPPAPKLASPPPVTGVLPPVVSTPTVMPPPVTAPAASPPVTIPPTPTPVATTSSGSTVTDSDIASLISALQTSGASQTQAVTSALSQLESAGVDTSSPPVQAAVQNAVAPSTGLSTTDMLLIGGAVLAAILLLKK